MASYGHDNFNFDVQNMCKKLFEEIEERKKHFERIELCQKKRMRDEQERRKIIQDIETQDRQDWEANRDNRVKTWRTFQKNKSTTAGKKRGRIEIRAPAVRMEERPASAPKNDTRKPMGVQDDYKRSWK